MEYLWRHHYDQNEAEVSLIKGVLMDVGLIFRRRFEYVTVKWARR